ncbi:MAG: CHAT domain-containing protein [Deltaproteobacteria bacterium]|nr:CHAT domain-containing protein [Deltaproteobacteria bacterium]
MLLLLFALGCSPKLKVSPKQTPHYNIYEDIILTHMGDWVQTDIHIPSGAIVAIMAQGKLRYIPDGSYYQSPSTLRFRIGKYGREIHLRSGQNQDNPTMVNIVKISQDGLLYFSIGRNFPKPSLFKSFKKATVIVWPQESETYINEDIIILKQLRPDLKRQIGAFPFLLPDCYYLSGEYEKANKLLIPLRQRYAWNPWVFIMSAAVESQLGRFGKANTFARIAVDDYNRSGNKRMEGIAQTYLARTLSNLGRYEEAIKISEKAINNGQEVKSGFITGHGHYWLGHNYLMLNDFTASLENTRKAISFFEEWNSGGFLADCYVNLGMALFLTDQYNEAKQIFKSALEVGRTYALPEPTWRAHSRLGRIADKENRMQEAFAHYLEAIKIIEEMRGKLGDSDLKSRFLEMRLQVYEWMIGLLVGINQPDDALHFLERAKARSILDMLQDKSLFSENRDETELLTRERDVRRRIDRLSFSHKLDLSEGVAGKETEENRNRLTELGRLRGEHRALLDKISLSNPELASLISINPLKSDDIKKLLDSDTVLLEYFISTEKNVIFVVTREKILAVPFQASQERIFNKIEDFRREAVDKVPLDQLTNTHYLRLLADLYDILIKPVENEIAAKKHLVIVPHSILHYLPFQALRSMENGKGRYLIESFSVSYLPSASVLKYARIKNKGNLESIFAAGNPETELLPIPAAEQEAKEVSDLFNEKLVLIGKEANESIVKDKAPEYDVVLLSTHGEMIDSDPLTSNLRFFSSKDDDGKLTVNEVFNMEIKANLVTLSACETGLAKGETGGFPKGDDLVGFSRAFIHAGAPSVVVSLWKVSDDSTTELMRRFFKNLQNMPKAVALQKAQVDLMNLNLRYSLESGGRGLTLSPEDQAGLIFIQSHPYFWAPFILVGDWR